MDQKLGGYARKTLYLSGAQLGGANSPAFHNSAKVKSLNRVAPLVPIIYKETRYKTRHKGPLDAKLIGELGS